MSETVELIAPNGVRVTAPAETAAGLFGYTRVAAQEPPTEEPPAEQPAEPPTEEPPAEQPAKRGRKA